jgi:hypothetical protein
MVCLCKYHNSIANLFSLAFIYLLFIYLLVSPYYNTQNYNKNKNNIHDYRQGDRNSVSQLLRARKTTQINSTTQIYTIHSEFLKSKVFTVQCLAFLKYIESFEDKRKDIRFRK